MSKEFAQLVYCRCIRHPVVTKGILATFGNTKQAFLLRENFSVSAKSVKVRVRI